jgi:hypothetical protein
MAQPQFYLHSTETIDIKVKLLSEVYCYRICHGPLIVGGPGSAVCIATGYGLDGRRSYLGRGKIFSTCPDRPWVPPSLLYNELPGPSRG